MVHVGIPVGVHVVLEQEGAVLLMRRAGTGFFDGLYSLPGGHVEPGESIRQAARRETEEEIGVTLALADLECLGVVHRLSDTNRIDFFLAARAWDGVPTLREPHKCDHLAWFPREALPHNTVPYIRDGLAQGAHPWIMESGWSGVG
ncbi:MAG: NUDIX domain-containing protein [Rhodocyclaceae bacterium]|jgi:mutator protein MutT|nr:NUDIX domain-containing protein [Rhodocyclaceae bacterium]